jgi:hypothetical protein
MATEKFHYLPEGAPKSKGIVLPRFGQLPGGVFRKLRKSSEDEQFFGLLEMLVEKKLITEKTLELIDEMPIAEQMRMMQAWQQEAGITLPESPASSTA